jgi:hypothetical protein
MMPVTLTYPPVRNSPALAFKKSSFPCEWFRVDLVAEDAVLDARIHANIDHQDITTKVGDGKPPPLLYHLY